MYSINLADGIESWVTSIDSGKSYSWGADIDDEYLYFGTSGHHDKRYIWKANKSTGVLTDSVFSEYMPRALVIHNSHLYCTFGWSSTGNSNSVGRIICFDSMNLDTLWIHDEAGGSLSMCTPIIEEDIMYMGTIWGADNKILALNAQTGGVIWENSSDNISAIKVLLVGELLYVETGASVRALNKLTGSQIWRSNFANPDESPNLSYWNGYIYIENYGTLFVLDATTGERVYSMHGPDNASVEQVSTGAGKIFVQSTQHLYAFTPYDPEKDSSEE